MKARAVNPRKPHEMTKPEMAWAEYPWFKLHFEHRRYEAITLRIGEFRYTPDFSGVCVKTGQLHLFEIKASDHRAAFTEAARLKLRATASEFPELRFFVCWPTKGTRMQSWTVTEIGNRSTRVPEMLPGQASFLEG
jgi:hypothetical protein